MPRPLTLHPRPLNKQRGVSMLEVMVSVVILSIGLLGMAGLQARALKGNQSSLQRSQAVMLSYSILDAIRADRTNAGTYTMAKTSTAPSGSTLVAATQGAWINNLQTALGSGSKDYPTSGTIACDASTCTITVTWDDSRGGGASTETLVTEGRI